MIRVQSGENSWGGYRKEEKDTKHGDVVVNRDLVKRCFSNYGHCFTVFDLRPLRLWSHGCASAKLLPGVNPMSDG